jgi:hypothetical protein
LASGLTGSGFDELKPADVGWGGGPQARKTAGTWF